MLRRIVISFCRYFQRRVDYHKQSNQLEHRRLPTGRITSHLNIEPQDKTRRIDQPVTQNKQGLKNARKKLLDGEIEIADLNEAKNIYQPEINRLQQELIKLNAPTRL